MVDADDFDVEALRALLRGDKQEGPEAPMCVPVPAARTAAKKPAAKAAGATRKAAAKKPAAKTRAKRKA